MDDNGPFAEELRQARKTRVELTIKNYPLAKAHMLDFAKQGYTGILFYELMGAMRPKRNYRVCEETLEEMLLEDGLSISHTAKGQKLVSWGK
jgi:hypothetical protein